MSYFNNALSIPVFLALAVLSEEHTMWGALANFSANHWSIWLVSGFLGFTLSTSAFLLNGLVTATSMMVANNVNKFAVVVLSEVFIKRTLGPLSTTGTAIVLVMGWLYSQASTVCKDGWCDNLCTRLGTRSLLALSTGVMFLFFLLGSKDLMANHLAFLV